VKTLSLNVDSMRDIDDERLEPRASCRDVGGISGDEASPSGGTLAEGFVSATCTTVSPSDGFTDELCTYTATFLLVP